MQLLCHIPINVKKKDKNGWPTQKVEKHEPWSLQSKVSSIGCYPKDGGYTEELRSSPSFAHCTDVLAKKRKLLKV